jgi:hypothetical protein
MKQPPVLLAQDELDALPVRTVRAMPARTADGAKYMVEMYDDQGSLIRGEIITVKEYVERRIAQNRAETAYKAKGE